MLKVSYGGQPPLAKRAPWVGGFPWEKDSTGNPWMAITCQREGAKIYFPCKDHPSDEPNEGADLIITVPKGLYVAGPLQNNNHKITKVPSTGKRTTPSITIASCLISGSIKWSHRV